MTTTPCILGISGAPCTGKTTLAGWLWRKLRADGLDCELLEEPARELVRRGVRIDQHMSEADYEAFLRAYDDRDRAAGARLAIADRTPVDHCSYLAANRYLDQGFVDHHRRQARGAMARYRLVLYLPVAFPLKEDGFRVTSDRYRLALDSSINAMLAEIDVPVVKVSGSVARRRRELMKIVRESWPELFAAQAGDALGI